MEKRKRVTDEKLLKFLKTQPCIPCGFRPEDMQVHHLKTQGSGGDDVLANLIPVCPKHHAEFHSRGTNTMRSRYPDVDKWLKIIAHDDYVKNAYTEDTHALRN